MNAIRELIFLGTVLLERNRWAKDGRRSSVQVSDWTQRAHDDGFDGLELWEDHVNLATEDERERLRTALPASSCSTAMRTAMTTASLAGSAPRAMPNSSAPRA